MGKKLRSSSAKNGKKQSNAVNPRATLGKKKKSSGGCGCEYKDRAQDREEEPQCRGSGLGEGMELWVWERRGTERWATRSGSFWMEWRWRWGRRGKEWWATRFGLFSEEWVWGPWGRDWWATASGGSGNCRGRGGDTHKKENEDCCRGRGGDAQERELLSGKRRRAGTTRDGLGVDRTPTTDAIAREKFQNHCRNAGTRCSSSWKGDGESTRGTVERDGEAEQEREEYGGRIVDWTTTGKNTGVGL